MVTFLVIKIHSNKDTFSLLLGISWLRMSNAIVNWGEVKSSIIYGPKDNRVKIRIETWDDWIRQDIVSSLKDEEAKEDNEKEDVLIERVHSGGHRRFIYKGSGSPDPSFYNHENDGEYVQ